jgi:UDP-N-acetylglucosamine 2-epimerase (non-hydrolysing)
MLNKKNRIMVVFGTRPEAIKMAPIIKLIKKQQEFDLRVCVTGQHRQMLDQVLSLFDIVPEYDLNLMKKGQTLTELTQSILLGLEKIFLLWRPDVVLVHGDTTTTFGGSLAAFYERIPVGHVEAGLRTGDIYSPWPEEMNRRLVGALATFHFAPTETGRENLLRENIESDNIHITGNSVIDALLDISAEIDRNYSVQSQLAAQFAFLDGDRKIILVTGHRRESFGAGFESICNGLALIAKRPDVQIVYPLHLNPNVQGPVLRILGDIENIHLIPPLDYLPFVYLMKRSTLILTDSGGIQEEAPSLGKPVLVMRDKTERPEAVAAGNVRVVGTDTAALVLNSNRLLDDSNFYQSMASAINPYGDGHAAERIVDILKLYFNR